LTLGATKMTSNRITKLIPGLGLTVLIASASAHPLAGGGVWAAAPVAQVPNGTKQEKPQLVQADVVHPPCHPNPHAQSDMATLAQRGDIRHVPRPLQERLFRLAGRPPTSLPSQTFAEADGPSLLFQYYLLDTHGFEPNVFTTRFPGVNDAVDLTVTGAVCGLPTIGSVRLALEPKPDLPTDP